MTLILFFFESTVIWVMSNTQWSSVVVVVVVSSVCCLRIRTAVCLQSHSSEKPSMTSDTRPENRSKLSVSFISAVTSYDRVPSHVLISHVCSADSRCEIFSTMRRRWRLIKKKWPDSPPIRRSSLYVSVRLTELFVSVFVSDVCVWSAQGPLVRWLKVNFSEAFIAWIHIKALRVFVESVLRYQHTLIISSL